MRRTPNWFWSYLLLWLAAPAALGHETPTSVAFLDPGKSSIDMEIQMPVDQLQIAAPELFASTPAPQQGVDRSALFDYLRDHVAIEAQPGTHFNPQMDEPDIREINGTPYVVARLRFAASDDAPIGSFRLHYDAILHRVVSHKIYLSLRSDFYNGQLSGKAKPLDVIRYRHESVQVQRAEGSPWSGFRAMVVAGAHHIASGTDHLLFLLCLLLPAPLLARRGRWREPAKTSHGLFSVLKIVTAFTLGHSLTLALAALGVVRTPSAPVEILVAVSVLISAVHAVRPVFGHHATLIALGFGLVHGLAFASELSGFGFSLDAVVLALAGFNLGIEGTQLLIVAAVVPCLRVIAPTRLYTPLRIVFALFAALAAVGWILERTWKIANPVAPWIQAAAANAAWLYAVLILIACACFSLTRGSSSAGFFLLPSRYSVVARKIRASSASYD